MTHGYIGIENILRREIIGIYVHNNAGYERLGRELFRHYTGEADVRALITLGKLSEVGADIGEAHDLLDRQNSDWRTSTASGHRDRNDDWDECKPRVHIGRTAFLQAARDCGAEVAYLYLPGTGWYAQAIGDTLEMRPLAGRLVERVGG